MKYALKRMMLAGATGLALLGPTGAYAGNAAIEKALSERPDVATFYEAAKKMGVLDGLSEGTTYTVFAPTNEAFASLTEEKYPCLYSDQCRPEIASLLSNHFVPKQVNFSGPVKATVFSVNGTNINLGLRNGTVNSVAGYRIVNRGQVFGGTICQINGVIATPQQLTDLSRLKVVREEQPPALQKKVTDKVYYAPDGTPDGVSRTITYEPARQ